MPLDEQLPILNAESFADLTFGEPDLQRELVEAFLTQAPGIADDLAALRDPGKLREVLHLLKGSCQVVAADRLLDITARAEMAHARPAGNDERSALVADVRTALSLTQAQLRALLASLPPG